ADAWGVQVKRSGSSINSHWYIGASGYLTDQPVSLYVRARHLVPTRGRWSSRDQESDADAYGYAYRQPTLLSDPSGKYPAQIPSDCHEKKKCYVLGILGFTGKLRDEHDLVKKVIDDLKAKGFGADLRKGEYGGRHWPPRRGNTLKAYDIIR